MQNRIILLLMKTLNPIRWMLAALLVIAFISCGKRTPKYVIGVSQCSEDIWRKKMNDELRIATLPHDNIELRIVSADDDVDKQIKQIDKLVEQGVDLLIVAPIQGDVAKAMDRAYDKGIPVIMFDRRTSSSKYTAYIGAENEEMGRNIAKFLSSRIDGSGRILEICGLQSSSPAQSRQKGFDHEAALHPNMDIVGHLMADWTQERAYHLMDSLLSGPHAEFDYVFAHNDRMAKEIGRASCRERV